MVEGRAICGKEALTVADTVVQEWILKHGTPIIVIGEKSIPQCYTKKSAIYSALLRCTPQHTVPRPMTLGNGATVLF